MNMNRAELAVLMTALENYVSDYNQEDEVAEDVAIANKLIDQAAEVLADIYADAYN